MKTQQNQPGPHLLGCEMARSMVVDIFGALAVPMEETSIVADHLLEASLSGYDSHGLMRVAIYAEDIRKGRIIPGVTLTIVHQTQASALVDAGNGLGPVTASDAMRLATQMAEGYGIGCVAVDRANDIGCLGTYVHSPATAGFIAIMLVNDAGGGPWVAPFGSIDPFLSTNPLAAGIPWLPEQPLVIDLSTSVVAGGKLKMLANAAKDPPEGWLIGKDGRSTTDLDTFFTEPRQSALLPLGGLLAGHKGFALSLLVDVLAGALSGAGLSSGRESDLNRNGVCIIVIDPGRFIGRQYFQHQVSEYVAALKSTRTVPGVDEVLVPGERAARLRKHRRATGIPVDSPTLQEIVTLLTELKLADRYSF